MKAAQRSFNAARDATLKLPDRLDGSGLLVAWSLELAQQRAPMGFSLGDPALTPETGFLDPILMNGDGHLLTIAPTGAGKGRSCIIPALLRHEGPVIVIDPKGENVAVTARRRREMGQQVVVLDPMGITDEPAGAFNPMDLIEADSVEAVDIATAFAAALVDGREDPDNSYWYQRGQFLLTSIMLHVATEKDAAQRTFGRVREMLAAVVAERRAGGGDRLAGMSAEIARSPHPEARLVASLLQSGAAEGLSSILSMAQNGVDFLRGPQILKSVGTSSFPLDAITRGAPVSIYLVLPPHMLESHGRLLRLWIMALIALITRRRGRPSSSTLFILDEAAQIGQLPQLRQAITLLRGYGVQTWSFWQDVTQISNLYRHDWQTMVNNCAVVQCFGALNLPSAKAMAELTGHGDGHSVLALNSHEMLLQMAGRPAVVARKADYLNDPPFAGQFDRNPFHDKARPVSPPPAARIRLHPVPEIVQPEEPEDVGLERLLRARPRRPAVPRRPPGATAPDPLLERLLALFEGD